MRLTDNFFRWEFACRCGCGFNSVDYELLTRLQEIRNELGHAITVNSGSRCLTHNTNEKGATNSYHLYSKAADIWSQAVSAARLYDLIDEMFPTRYGLIKHRNFVHFDVRLGTLRSFDWS